MPTSINGWPVLDDPAWGDPRARKDKVPGVGTQLWVRDECWPLFAALIRDYDNTIRPVTISDGYDYRQARAASSWSDHSSGTAIDLNYDAEGAQGTGQRGWWESARRYVKATRLKRRYKVLIWGGAADLGGDYHQPQNWDWMHWAIKPETTVADVKAVIKALRIDANGVRHRPNGSPVWPTS